jgi:hypothetical protein
LRKTRVGLEERKDFTGSEVFELYIRVVFFVGTHMRHK